MKKYFLILSILLSPSIYAQSAADYLEKIRNNPVKLTAFFEQMPKGGDLHHHYSGSIYAETYIKYVVDHDYIINTKTLEVVESIVTADTNWKTFSKLATQKLLPEFKQKLIQKWSVKDYNGISYPSDKHFFETFGAFSVASGKNIDSGFLELKARAKSENVSYIETMFSSIKCVVDTSGLLKWNNTLRTYQNQKNKAGAETVLNTLYKSLMQKKALTDCAKTFTTDLTALHQRLKLDDSTFTIRYQTYITRTLNNPVELFKNLVVAFEAANGSPLIVGVNIVAPEDNETSMKDYWLHMQMFSYCHQKYPNVKIAMHAGELTLGLVKPEELTWHINAAVRDAQANRIGHGVDVAHEKESYDLLKYMNAKSVAVEINLVSNEFILKVKDRYHPVLLYKDFNVPMVLCTDDVGILRSNLTAQYVLLAYRYPEFKYSDIKKIVLNSINYSFIEEGAVRQKLLADLEKRFTTFENKVKDF